MKRTKVYAVISATAIMTVISPVSIFAENTAVYEDFNKNDINGTVTVTLPEDTTAEVQITFTSPEVTDEPYYIASMTAGSSQSFDIEGRDTTEDDYRNYTLTVAITGGQYEDTVTYTDTFTVPDGNDNPDSFMQCEYIFTADDIYTGSNWDISSENKSQKNITVHFGDYKKGDVNGDGFIDAVDATSVLVEYASNSTGGGGTFTERQKLSADVNNDGFIDAVDATQILVYYAQLSTGGNPSWISGNNTGTTTTDSTPQPTTTSTAISYEGTTTTTTTATHSLTIDYSSYIKSINMLAGSHDDTITIHRYYVCDINGDGVYELITEMGTGEEDNKYSVYSMKSGEMTFAGDIEAGYSHLSVNNGTLYKIYGQGQTADVDKILFDGKTVVSETVGKETDVDTGTFLDAYDWSDISGIENIGKNNIDSTTTAMNTTSTETTTTTTTTTATTTTTTAIDWQSAYKTKLNLLADEYNFTASSDDNTKAMYDLVDINGNGIPELIVSDGEFHASACKVYTYVNGGYTETTFSDNTDGFASWGTMGVDTANHVARSYYYGMGYEYIDFYRLEGIQFVNIASFSNDEGNGGSDYKYNDSSVSQSQYQTYRSQYNYSFDSYGREYTYTPVNTVQLSAPVIESFRRRTESSVGDGVMIYATWNSISNADGYEVEKIETQFSEPYKTTVTTQNTYVETGGSVSINIKARVRAYKTVNGKKIYSEWSNTSECELSDFFKAAYNQKGQINCHGGTVAGFTTDYVVNGGSVGKVRNSLGDTWHVTAHDVYYRYGLTWFELYDTDDGDYYGWVDSNYIDFYN